MSKRWTLDDVKSKGLSYTIVAPEVQEKPKKRPKYGNKKTTVDQIEFDSKFEAYLYSRAKQMNLIFDTQYKLPVTEPVQLFDIKLKRSNLYIDFVFYSDATKQTIIACVDTKGMITQTAKLKIQIAKKNMEEKGLVVTWSLPKTKGEVEDILNHVKERMSV
jgi:hypothetical protein